ncbi:MAG: EF-hand domain-containing protein [Oceanicaulis sp.]
MKTTALFGAAAALALGGAAVALDHHDSGQETGGNDETSDAHDDTAFDMMYESRLQRAFSAIDANDDGSISYEEWGEWQADDGFYAERFSIFDTDSDRSISWEEYKNATMSLYDTSSLMEDEAGDMDDSY